jgi:peptide deformylase
MILPIVLYNNPVLREVATDYEFKTDLNELIDNMFETMHNANGVGLAAPQVGISKRLFVISNNGIDKEFINARITNESGREIEFPEGCLSIPTLSAGVTRKSIIEIQYYDREWNLFKEEITGFQARVIQHEHDHLEGKLFFDDISPTKKIMLTPKLKMIQTKILVPSYPHVH